MDYSFRMWRLTVFLYCIHARNLVVAVDDEECLDLRRMSFQVDIIHCFAEIYLDQAKEEIAPVVDLHDTSAPVIHCHKAFPATGDGDRNRWFQCCAPNGDVSRCSANATPQVGSLAQPCFLV